MKNIFKEKTNLKKCYQLGILRLTSNNYYHTGKCCLSCKMRSINSENAYPCVHYLYKLYKENVYIKYEDLSSVCFKEENTCIIDANYSRNDITQQTNYSVLNNIAYTKLFHNKNEIARNNVDKRRKRLKIYYLKQ